MSKKRFDKAFAKFIRSSEEKITPKTFFQVLDEIERERAQKTIELQARIVEGQLQFAPSPELSVRGNEIWLGQQRIVVHVSSGD
ncbi:MAG: hypothetical protein JMDDDDMK_02858 [Acidobacteria bacterium]|nr:hypothetical protein [Acidobacteriota bacterium]